MFLPLRIQRSSGVWPLESVAFTFAPYCKRSSSIPMSAVSQARWRRVHPSRSSTAWPSLVPLKFEELGDDLSNESPAKQLEVWSWPVCSCISITLARVNEEAHDACSYTAFKSGSELTMWRYTAFLSLARTPSQICCAIKWVYCASFGFRTKSFSAYYDRNKINI